MERKTNKQKQASLLLLSLHLLLSVVCADNFQNQKNFFYFPPADPNIGTPPAVPVTPPAYAPPTPTNTPRPSHGGGSSGHSPPANCGNPPSESGRHRHSNPSHSPPRASGGGYYHSPPSTTPSRPSPTPSRPSTPTPVVVSPPTTPIITPGTPSTPGITVPSPPFPFDPNSPPFTCTYWRNHPTLIWGLFGWWGTTLGNAFGITSLPGTGTGTGTGTGIGSNMSLLDALSNTRTDGYGDLYREGTAALLNAMAHTRFPYTTSQVRDGFVSALGSNKAAANQAQVFKLANEGRTKI